MLPNSEVKLIDDEGQEIDDPRKPGEILYRGPNVAVGYLNRPDATNATFLKGGWCRTGDQAIFDEVSIFSL